LNSSAPGTKREKEIGEALVELEETNPHYLLPVKLADSHALVSLSTCPEIAY
jgi:hypothetical protein